MALHVVLYEPEIPANTGNIARTCLATAATLHLIHPLGFEISDKQLKRAGLDYWKKVKVREYERIEDFFELHEGSTFYFVEDYGSKTYADLNYNKPEEDIFFIFGPETRGIPVEILKEYEDRCIRIPMGPGVRSLNLSNTVALILYEALRQQNYPGMK